MQFPTPSYAHARTSSNDDSVDPFQWGKFDSLFEQVFGPSKSSPAQPPFPALGRARGAPTTMPGGFARGRVIGDGSECGSNYGDAEEEGDFNKMWQNALRKTKKTLTTTTKRRIIRHTPDMDMPMPTPTIIARTPQAIESPYAATFDDSEPTEPLEMPVPSTPPRRNTPENTFTSPPGSNHSRSSSSSSSSGSSDASSSVHSSPRSYSENHQFIVDESSNPSVVTATFEMPIGLTKNDIHVSYSTSYGAERVTVSWQSVTIEESVETGKLVRERKERKYARTLPLPKGTQFREVKATLHGGVLTVIYPSSRFIDSNNSPLPLLN